MFKNKVFFNSKKAFKINILNHKLFSFSMQKMERDNICESNTDTIPTSKNEQKNKSKSDKKSNKKLAKAIHVLKYHEGGEEMKKEIFSKGPKNNLWIYHFGNGDEDDQISIKNYFLEKFGECKVYIFPGISYGFLELGNTVKLENFTNSGLIEKSYPFFDFEVNFLTGMRKIFAFFSNIPLQEVQENKNSTFPIASYKIDIPGLYIIDDFLSEEEEKTLIEYIDSFQWTKLTNRKVQHYGYEFIYGANNVNKNNKIGEIPYFGIDLNLSK